jgi:hypothetical protein
MSPSFPYNGTTTAVARRYDVTIDERWAMPPISPTIVGKAVDKITGPARPAAAPR